MLCSRFASRSDSAVLELLADHETQPVRRVARTEAGRDARRVLASRAIDDVDLRQPRLADALGQREQRVLRRSRAFTQLSRLGVALPRTTTAPSFRARTIGDFARVIARRLALLVARLVLLVDDDGAEVVERREDRRARADGDPLAPFARARATRRTARRRSSALCSTAILSPNTARKRSTVCGVSAISGTSTIAVFPRSSTTRRSSSM